MNRKGTPTTTPPPAPVGPNQDLRYLSAPGLSLHIVLGPAPPKTGLMILTLAHDMPSFYLPPPFSTPFSEGGGPFKARSAGEALRRKSIEV
jgi:hypothetical protein